MQFSFVFPILALAGSGLVSAQTFIKCGPNRNTAGATLECPTVPGDTNQQFVTDFSKIPEGTKTPPPGWKDLECAGVKNYVPGKGLDLVLGHKGDCPTLISEKYYLFGSFEVNMQAAAGNGIVSSITLEADNGDEIDWEWAATDQSLVQTNYFGHGDTDNWSHGGKVSASDVFSQFHTYTVDWTPTAITFSVDGKPLRTVTAAQAGKMYPQTPMRVKLGPWSGGDSPEEGTRTWAGGPTDWSKQYAQTVKAVKVDNYTPAESFSYSDNSGLMGSVVVHGGVVRSGAPSSASPPAAASPSGGNNVGSVPVGNSPVAVPSGSPSTMVTVSMPVVTTSATAAAGVTATATGGARVATQISDGQVQAPTTVASASATKTAAAQQTKNAASGLSVNSVGSSSFAALVLGLLVVIV